MLKWFKRWYGGSAHDKMMRLCGCNDDDTGKVDKLATVMGLFNEIINMAAG